MVRVATLRLTCAEAEVDLDHAPLQAAAVTLTDADADTASPSPSPTGTGTGSPGVAAGDEPKVVTCSGTAIVLPLAMHGQRGRQVIITPASWLAWAISGTLRGRTGAAVSSGGLVVQGCVRVCLLAWVAWVAWVACTSCSCLKA